jgi:hypothetical protein
VSFARLLSASSLLLVLLGGTALLFAPACSEAETPDGSFDGGGRPDGGFAPFDAGPNRGGRDQPCAEGRCRNNSLTCVDDTGADGGTVRICRLVCDRDDTTDPCGAGSTCGRLTNGGGACLPAGALDDPCPCDEGFTCVAPDYPDGGIAAFPDGGEPATLCKPVCTVAPADAGPGDAGGYDSGCAPDQCVRLLNSQTAGACCANSACLPS